MNSRFLSINRNRLWSALLALFLASWCDGFAQFPAVIRFATAETVVEESATRVTIPLYRSTGLGSEARISFVTHRGSAVPGVNYTEAAGEVTFLPQDRWKQIEIPILDDGIYIDAGSFQVELTAGAGTAIGEPGGHTVKIQDNDGPGEFEFRHDSSGTWEGNPYAEIDVVRKKGSVGTVEVAYQTEDGTAVAGTDYVATSGVIVFESGVMQKKIRIQTLDNDLFELDASLAIQLTSVSNGGALGQRTTHALRINDSDPEPSFWFAAATSTVREGEKYLAIPVARRGLAEQAWQIGYTVKSGTAEAPADFHAVSGVLKFEPSTTEATIFVPLVDDDTVERDETFTVELTNPDHYFWLDSAISRSPHTVTIIDEDTVYASGTETYVGLVEYDGDFFLGVYGTVTVTIGKTGRFSGVFRYQGSSYPFRSKVPLYVERPIGMQIPRLRDAFISIQRNPDGARVEGKISAPYLPTFKFTADRAKLGAMGAPVAESGRYTAFYTTYPQASFALEVSANGGARLLGIAPNGRGFAAGGSVDRNGRFSAILPAQRSEWNPTSFNTLGGSIDLRAGGPMNVRGELFTRYGGKVEVYGATYLPVANGRILSDFDVTNGAGHVHVSARGDTTRSVTWSARNHISFSSLARERWTLNVDPKTGLFRGSVSFREPTLFRFGGVCIQQPGERDDFMTGAVNFRGGSGSISIAPELQ